jgi:periplasmic protein TonB
LFLPLNDLVSMTTSQSEREKKMKAGLSTAAINVFILLVMIFAGAWQTPGSGPGDYPGIEVNLGYDDQGSGNIEPATPIGAEEATDDQNPPAELEPDQTEPEAAAPEPVEEVKTTTPVEEKILTDPNSDVEIKEEVKEKPVEKPVEKKPVVVPDKPVEKPAETKPVEKPKVDSRAVYPSKSNSTATPGNGDGKQGTAGNQGDDVGKEGNKGVPGGTEGANVYKGRPGGGDGGTGLDLDGWNWDYIPKPNIPDNQTGRIVFQIEVDENGELVRYRKESGTVSAAAERACIEAIQKLTFTKKSGAKVPEISKGRITFVIRAQ